MAHFAKIDENNIVQQIIVVSNENCGNLDFPESESIGQNFINSIGLEGNWKQTSYNSTFRKRYAGIGFTYDPIADEFVTPWPEEFVKLVDEESVTLGDEFSTEEEA